MQNKIIKLAEKNGADGVFNKTTEELAELIQAVCKFLGTECNNPSLVFKFNNLIEEIADVEIMLAQLKYTLEKRIAAGSVNAIEDKKAEKIERQILRFGLKGGVNNA